MRRSLSPRHLGTLVWSGEHVTRRAAFTDSRGAHQDEGDPLGHHGPRPQEAEEDEYGREDVSEGEFEGDVQSVGEGRGSQDTDGLLGAQPDRAADGELWSGGEEGEQDQGQEEEPTLLQPGQHPGGSLDQE